MSFATHSKISEEVGVNAGVVSADGSGGVTTSYADMAQNRRALVHAQVSAGAVSTIQLREAQDDAGTGAQDLGSAVSVGTADGVAEVDASALSEGYTHVAAVITADGPNPTAGTLVTAQSRFSK